MNPCDDNSSLPKRKRLRLTDYDYSQGGGYFITINAIDKIPLLGTMAGQQVNLSAVGGMVKQTWNEKPIHYPGVMLDAFMVMPDHIHGIIVLCDPALIAVNNGLVRGPAPTQKPIEIPVLMRHFKAMTTKRYFEIKNSHPGSRLPDKLWQGSYYERIIRSNSDMEEKREYISTNPLREYQKTNV